jgi:hypothetical protein
MKAGDKVKVSDDAHTAYDGMDCEIIYLTPQKDKACVRFEDGNEDILLIKHLKK